MSNDGDRDEQALLLRDGCRSFVGIAKVLNLVCALEGSPA